MNPFFFPFEAVKRFKTELEMQEIFQNIDYRVCLCQPVIISEVPKIRLKIFDRLAACLISGIA